MQGVKMLKLLLKEKSITCRANRSGFSGLMLRA